MTVSARLRRRAARGPEAVRPGLHGSARDDAADRAEQADFAAFAAALVQALPDVDDFVVGNEPNLEPFWLPQFGPTGQTSPPPATRICSRRSYDALKAVDPNMLVLGGALSPRGDDRPGSRPRHALADGVHPRPRRRLPRERAHEAADGRLRAPPVHGGVPVPADDRGTRRTPRSRSPTTRSSSRSWRGVRRHRPARRRRCRSYYTEFGVRRASRAKSPGAYTTTGSRPGDSDSRPFDGDAGGLLPLRRSSSPFCQPTVRRALPLPHVRRGRPRPAGSPALYYRGRHAEVEPAGGLRERRCADLRNGRFSRRCSR